MARQNYFNTLTMAQKLDQLGRCRFMNASEFNGIEKLKGKKVVIVGCGAQGLNQGLNMRDSGLDVSYALRQGAIEGFQRTGFPAPKDEEWRKLMRDVRFRRALSLAIDRDELNQVVYIGLAKPSNNTIMPRSELFKPEYATKWANYDPKLANKLLDEIGLTKKDSQGIRLLPDGRPATIVVEHASEETEDADALALIADYPLVGVGGGAFLSAFPAYRTGDEYVQVPYPASLPLQHAASYGVPAGPRGRALRPGRGPALPGGVQPGAPGRIAAGRPGPGDVHGRIDPGVLPKPRLPADARGAGAGAPGADALPAPGAMGPGGAAGAPAESQAAPPAGAARP